MTEKGIAAARVEVTADSTPGVMPAVLLGHSHAFCRLRESLSRVVAGEGPVLLRGERGAGRALVARAIHLSSTRARGPFMVVSCAGTPETLIETELFGCVKGAVVGASRDRLGLLDAAHGGSLFLEDLDQMSPRTQSLLVRFLETGEVYKVGALGTGTPADVRILASVTVSAGSDHGQGPGVIRADLRSHFMAAELAVPALRERPDDIPILADYFARAAAGRMGLPLTTFTSQAHSALESYTWPGNVAELKRVVERLVADARFGEVRAEDLPVGIRPRLLLAAGARRRRTVAESLFRRLVAGGESFWTCVYPLFMRREITRMDVRDLVRRGMESVEGSEEALMRLFNMPLADRSRFDRFLRRYQCEAVSSPGQSSDRPLWPSQQKVSETGDKIKSTTAS